MSENSEDQLRTITTLAANEYQNHSLIHRICDLRSNPNLRDFKQFNEGARHNHTLYQINELEINQMIDRLVVDETNYLIEQINQNSISGDAKENILESVQNSITELLKGGFNPTSIIVPRRMIVEIPKWNLDINQNLKDNSYTKFYVGLNQPLNVAMPVQNVEFNQIMILSDDSNNWEYIPKTTNTPPPQIGTELTNTDIVFWFREECKFTNNMKNGIQTLNLPSE